MNVKLQFSVMEAISKGNDVKRLKINYIKSDDWNSVNKKTAKIYILKHNNKIIYVGITKMPLLSRFRYGLLSSGKNGYHGYAWKKLAGSGKTSLIDLYVYFFENNEKIETIEAEIAYLVRNKTGNWPEYQTEIHFHQSTDKEKAIAEKIFNEVIKN